MKRKLKKVIRILIEFRLNFKFKKKINIIFAKHQKDLDPLNKDIIREHISLWSKVDKKINIQWLKVFVHVSGQEKSEFVPENIYYNVIEPRLNNRIFTFAYADKNIYEKLYQNKEIFPRVYLRKINGTFYDQSYHEVIPSENTIQTVIKSHAKLIIKPSVETGGGKNIELLEKYDSKEKMVFKSSGEEVTLNILNKYFPHSFVLQELIQQHPFFSQFNPSSINTVRVFTYRSFKTEEVIPIQAVIRIGQPGSIVDNQASGGISVGVSGNGQLNTFAIDKIGNKYNSFNGIEFSAIGDVYMFSEILKKASELGKTMFYSRLNGFDFCIDKNSNIKLLEINTKNIETNFMQMSNGPLFGKYTQEIIEHCLSSKKIVSINFKF